MKLCFTVLLCFLGMQTLAIDQDAAFYAISQKNTLLLKKILKQNSQFTQTNDAGQTILHAAVISGNRQMVKVILKSGFSSINQLDKDGKTAMDYAVEYGYEFIIMNLIRYNAKVTSVENAEYLVEIVQNAKKSFLHRIDFVTAIFILSFVATLGAFVGFLIAGSLGLITGAACSQSILAYLIVGSSSALFLAPLLPFYFAIPCAWIISIIVTELSLFAIIYGWMYIIPACSIVYFADVLRCRRKINFEKYLVS